MITDEQRQTSIIRQMSVKAAIEILNNGNDIEVPLKAIFEKALEIEKFVHSVNPNTANEDKHFNKEGEVVDGTDAELVM